MCFRSKDDYCFPQFLTVIYLKELCTEHFTLPNNINVTSLHARRLIKRTEDEIY